MMLLTLAGIFGVILTAAPDDGTEPPPIPMYVLYILLIFNPFLSAGGQVAMRKMSKFSDCVVSWYLQWAVMSSSALVMVILGEPFTIFKYFDWQSWLLILAAAATSVYSETVRFKALKL